MRRRGTFIITALGIALFLPILIDAMSHFGHWRWFPPWWPEHQKRTLTAPEA